MNGNIFTEEQIQFIKDNYRKITAKEIGDKLGKTAHAIRRKAYLIGAAKTISDANKPGDRFYKLILLEEVPAINGNNRAWLCGCDCGTVKRIDQSKLREGKIYSCGCYNRDVFIKRNLKPPGETSWASAFKTYRDNAKIREYSFNLSLEEFKNIASKDCGYCKAKPKQWNPYLRKDRKTRSRAKRVGDVSDETITRAFIFLTGIDRVDNNSGYSLSNCVPCCSDCNRAKREMTKEQYIALCKRVVENLDV